LRFVTINAFDRLLRCLAYPFFIDW